MIHEIIPVGPLRCNCSILGDEATRDAMVIDPGGDLANIVAILEKHQLTVKQIIITHAHLDHVGAAMKLRALTGAPILLNEEDYALLQMLDLQAAWLNVAAPDAVQIDGGLVHLENVAAGPLRATVLHTPGHTEGSICLYLESQQTLIAGDTLFAGSIGRTDLPGGSYNKIIRSIHDHVLTLPDETKVFPGHGGQTTIGHERATNPFLIKG